MQSLLPVDNCPFIVMSKVSEEHFDHRCLLLSLQLMLAANWLLTLMLLWAYVSIEGCSIASAVTSHECCQDNLKVSFKAVKYISTT